MADDPLAHVIHDLSVFHYRMGRIVERPHPFHPALGQHLNPNADAAV